MKKFETPMMEMEKLDIMDVITVSGGGACADDLCFTDGMDCDNYI